MVPAIEIIRMNECSFSLISSLVKFLKSFLLLYFNGLVYICMYLCISYKTYLHLSSTRHLRCCIQSALGVHATTFRLTSDVHINCNFLLLSTVYKIALVLYRLKLTVVVVHWDLNCTTQQVLTFT
jgi:hypothetical protein